MNQLQTTREQLDSVEHFFAESTGHTYMMENEMAA